MIRCKNCGHEFDEGIYCPECGTLNDVEERSVIDDADREGSLNDVIPKTDLENSEYISEETKETYDSSKPDYHNIQAGLINNSEERDDRSPNAGNTPESSHLPQKEMTKIENKNNKPVLVLILGLISLALCIISMGFIPAIIAIVMGIIDIKKHGKDGKTIVGMICAGISLLTTIIVIIVIAVSTSQGSKRDELIKAGQYAEALEYMEDKHIGSEKHYYAVYVGLEQYDAAANYLLNKADKKETGEELLEWDKQHGQKLDEIYEKVSDPVRLRIDEYRIRVANAGTKQSALQDSEKESELDQGNNADNEAVDDNTFEESEQEEREASEKTETTQDDETELNDAEEDETEEEPDDEMPVSIYPVTIKVTYEKKLLAYNNDMAIYVDGERIFDVAAGETNWERIELSRGKHKVWADDISKVRWLNKSSKKKITVDGSKPLYHFKLSEGNFGLKLEEID